MKKLKFFLSLLMLFTFSIGTMAADYELYTGSTIAEGDYIIVGKQNSTSKYYALNNACTNSQYMGITEVTDDISADKISNPASSLVWTVSATEHGYYITNGSDYLDDNATSNKNYAQLVTDATSTCIWTFAISDGLWTITNYGTETTKKTLAFNVGSSRVATYAAVQSGHTQIYLYKKSSGPSVSVSPSALDFGTVDKGASVAAKTFSVTGSNLTGAISIAAPSGYTVSPTSITPTDGSIAATDVTVTPVTSAAGTFDGNVSITDGGLGSAVNVALTMTVQGPEVILKSNSTLDPIDEINFGNVGKNRDKSAQFAFSFKRLETGTLTITVSDDFAFSGDSPTKEIEITSASGTNTDVSIFKNTTTVKNITNGWLKFTGCGLPSEGVFYDVKMNVKEPTVSINITSTQDDPYDFGSIRQHTVCSECGGDIALKTIHIQAQYLASDIFTGETGAIYDLNPSRIYIDEDGAVDQDLNVYISTGTAGTYAYDRYDDNKNWKMRIYSGAVTPEFEEIYIYPSVTITPTYRVGFQVYDNDRGTITINGVESNEYGRAAAYVADGSEDITMVATPKLGYRFSEWQVDNADKTIVTIDDAASASTYANVTSEPAADIIAMFVFDCNALNLPYYPAYTEVRYNEADLQWQWVRYSDDSKVADYVVEMTEKGTENTSQETVHFTSSELEASEASYTFTGLKGSTTYQFKVWATTDRDGYCETGKESVTIEFTTPDYPDATLTLSENGTTHALSGSHKVADVVTLPSTVTKEVVGKVFVGWSSLTIETPTDTKPGVATFWEPGASYTILSETDKLYAVYATATPGVPSSHNLGTATLNGSSTGSNTASANYSLYLTSTTDKAGYVQDKGTAGESVISVKLYVTNSESQIISSQPSAIKVTASLGGGSAKNPLDNSVYAVLLDNNNDELGDAVVLTTSIAGQSGTDYTASLPIANYADVRGVKVYHLKEDGYNVRYYSVDFKYETGGENTYSQYTTKGAKILSDLTFSPAEGTKTSATNVEITSPDGGTIYYTTDGTAPTDASTEYTGAIALTTYGEHVIKAIAIDGDDQSEVATATYFLNLPFASLEDLVAANLASGTTNVTVSFSNVEITDINNSNRSVYLNVKDNGGVNNIQLFNYTALTESWMVGGKLSGTITCTWTEYSSKWELVITSWTTGITYTKPASGLEWSAASATAYTVGKSYELPTLTNAKSLAVAYSSTTTSVATIDSESGVVTLVGAGSTTIKATASDAYADNEVSYTLTVTAPSTLLISGTLTKQDYELGDAIDPTGLVATVKYGNNDTWDPSDATFEFSQDPIVMGQTTVQAWAHWNAMTSAISESLTARMKYHKVVAATGIEHGSIAIKDGSSTASTGADYWKGKSLKVVATPDSKYELDKIYINGVEQSGVVDNELTFDVPGTDPAGADITVSATFKKLPKSAFPMSWKKAATGYTLTYGTYTEPFLYSRLTIAEAYKDEVVITSSDPTVVDVSSTYYENDGLTVYTDVKKVGTTTFTAYFAGDDDYAETSVTYELTVQKGEASLSWSASEFEATIGASNTFPTASNPRSLDVTYDSSDETVATIASNGDITLLKAGTTTITIATEGNSNFNAGNASYVLTVLAHPTNGVVTLSTKTITMDNVTLGAVSGPTGVVWVSASNMTPGAEVTFSIDGTDGLFEVLVPSTGKMTVDGEGKISEFAVNIISTETARATYGLKEGVLRISGADLAADSLVAIQMWVGGIVTITPNPVALDLGSVVFGDDRAKYGQSFHLNITNMISGQYNQVRVNFTGNAFWTAGSEFITDNDQDGVIDVDVTIVPSEYWWTLSESNALGVQNTTITIVQTGTRQFEDVVAGTATMTVVESATALDDLESGEKVEKVLDNGVVYIIRDGARYNLLGEKVK